MEKLTPQTILGKISLVLIILMPILFILGGSFTNLLYPSVPAGNSIQEDIMGRPALALTMLIAMISGISAFIIGLIAIIKQKERSTLVYIATILGAVLIVFLIGELAFPH